jgi:histidine triad (HIT) family protein
MVDDCIFCKIARGEIPSAKIWEDEKAFAFLDINPSTNGHALVIPKEHYANMEETPNELLSHLFQKTKMLMPKLKEAMNADYVAISIVGTDVAHFHIHIIPRTAGDGLAGFWPTKRYKEGEEEIILNKIKEVIRN